MFAKVFIILGILVIALVGAFQIDTVREFFGQASGEEANIQVNTTAVLGSFERPWRNLAQGGEDNNWRMTPIIPKVRALNPEYIRIDHIYDFYEILQGNPGSYTYDFSKLDPIIDDILSTGAKPYIALSYMPIQLADGDIVGQPNNYGDWQNLVQATVQHISGTRGISDVYYEVWNEPDLFGGYKYYGGKNYLNLYTASARGAQNVRGAQPFKIGGPATTGFYKNWIEALVKHADASNLRLDFVSWHRYSRNIDQYKDDMIGLRKVMQKYPKFENTIEYHITEWGHDSENDLGYDTRYSAAHTVAGSIEMVGTMDRAFVFEIQDGKDPQGQEHWGRWGLLTHQDFGSNPKSRYFALRMLDRISDQRLQLLGKGTWVKALAAKNTDNNNIEVVLANYDQRGVHGENVPITFDNVTPGSYTITKELNTGQNITEKVATTAAKLRTHLFMPNNSVGFVTLKKN